MGQTYYYYYEVNGSTETHDPSLPTTNVCPYLPGQTVNTLEVPSEHQLRYRSASMNSLRATDFNTMDPNAKFTTPRPAPSVPEQPGARVKSSPSIAPKRCARSLSPAPRWSGAARRLFGLRPHGRETDRGRRLVESESESESESDSLSIQDNNQFSGTRSTTPSEGVRSRDMSPESLRRFLSDDKPMTPPALESGPTLRIPEDIVEDMEDDENFATSAASESAPFTTLSPPPFLRSHSASSVTSSIKEAKGEPAITLVPEALPLGNDTISNPTETRLAPPSFKLNIPRSHFSTSTTSSTMVSPTSFQSAESRDLSQLSFFDDSEEDEDFHSNEDDSYDVHRTRRSADEANGGSLHVPFTGYSLPQATTESTQLKSGPVASTSLGSPAFVARTENGLPAGNTSLFNLPNIDTGLDDLASDLRWMSDIIRPKDI
ncbi:Uu.00g059180.m01.CDS01 [Anthostomella pinea]|uniref:Uu.00g059180.m01.CDS01 n=1 Tax=Anthostomella pinea TaxID=933095 RepID=A0AAI8VSV0_9PEZI|nr:Uu.00g059180.m01.CDS01 [Anthostomella pinea]